MENNLINTYFRIENKNNSDLVVHFDENFSVETVAKVCGEDFVIIYEDDFVKFKKERSDLNDYHANITVYIKVIDSYELAHFQDIIHQLISLHNTIHKAVCALGEVDTAIKTVSGELLEEWRKNKG